MRNGFPEFSALHAGAGICYAIGVAVGGPFLMLMLAVGTFLVVRSERQKKHHGIAEREWLSGAMAVLAAVILAGVPIALAQSGLIYARQARYLTACGIVVLFLVGWWDARRRWKET